MKANFFKMYISGCPEGALAMIVHLTKPEYEYLMQNKHMTGAFLKRYKQMITD